MNKMVRHREILFSNNLRNANSLGELLARSFWGISYILDLNFQPRQHPSIPRHHNKE